MKKENDFEYRYVAPTSEERREIESIRKSYAPQPQKDKKLEELRKLDAKVKNIPTIIGLVFGITGLLIFGLGMAMVLEWGIILWGVIVSIIGAIPIALAYPLCLKAEKKLKDKYTSTILRLSDELLEEKEEK